MIPGIINIILLILAIVIANYTEKYANKNGFTDENFDESTIKKYKKEIMIRLFVYLAFMMLVCLIANDISYSLGCNFFLAISNHSLTKKYVKLKSK